MNNIPEWDEHKYKTLWSVILGHVSENIWMSQLNLLHKNKNSKVKKKNYKVKMDMLRSIGKQSGKSVESLLNSSYTALHIDHGLTKIASLNAMNEWIKK